MNEAGALAEPDFERRLKGFFKFNETLQNLSCYQIIPIVRNLLYFLQDPEFSIYSNATGSLEKLVEHVAQVRREMKKKGMQLDLEGRTARMTCA